MTISERKQSDVSPVHLLKRRSALMATLDELRIGQSAQIVDVSGDDAVAIRLMEMGLTDGEAITLLAIAPLGDPLEFLVRGYRISLRRTEARRVLIDAVAPSS